MFFKCRCCCQMLLCIYTPFARVLFSSLDVCSHFPPVAWPSYRSLAIFGTGAKLHLCGSSSKSTVWCVRGLYPAQYVLRRPTRPALAAHSRSFERPRSRTVQFRAPLLFVLVFECIMGCMSLSLLVKVWVLLKFQSIVFFYKVDCPLFLPSLRLFLFHFPGT